MAYLLTPSAGKRLIAKAVTKSLLESNTIKSGVIVLIAGTTNGYIAEELLNSLNQGNGFSRNNFFRGISTPPSIKTSEQGRMPDNFKFNGDVIIDNGIWQKGLTIFDYVDKLKMGDIIVKGANCVDCKRKNVGILIGHPKGGTIMAVLQAVIGRRVSVMFPVGLEKRVTDDINLIAATLNSPDSIGLRLMPVQGDIVTELEAIELLCGTKATLVAAGGVYGAEGAVWINISGSGGAIAETEKLIDSIASEPLF